MQENVKAREEVDGQTSQLLDLLDEVRSWIFTSMTVIPHLCSQAYKKWSELPMEEVQSWALQTAESLNGSRPP